MTKYFSYDGLFQDLSQVVMVSRKSKVLKHSRDVLVLQLQSWQSLKEQVSWRHYESILIKNKFYLPLFAVFQIYYPFAYCYLYCHLIIVAKML